MDAETQHYYKYFVHTYPQHVATTQAAAATTVTTIN